jgi:predicted NBD/HSP70 family sugar kinase
MSKASKRRTKRSAKLKSESDRHAKAAPVSDGLHGQWELPAASLTSYNLEVRGKYGFIGDQASGRAFRKRLEELGRVARAGQMAPVSSLPSSKTKKKRLDEILSKGEPVAGAVVHSAVEEFAQSLAEVIRRYLKQPAWKRVERIVVGGGLSDSRVGELAIGRAAILLRQAGIKIDIVPIGHHPDQAGLIGGAFLVPTGILRGFNAILAVDIGGTNLRCGIVTFEANARGELNDVKAVDSTLWRHRDDAPSRDQLIKRLVTMLHRLEKTARKSGLKLAPVVAVGCPGIINPDGSIMRGTQNLPGNWQGKKFNLPLALKAALPKIARHDTLVVLHNDAVVQGLSFLPSMRDVKEWGALTIGTGLGNASYRNGGA